MNFNFILKKLFFIFNMNKITSTQKQIFSLLADPHASHKIKSNLVNALDSQSIDKICEFIFDL